MAWIGLMQLKWQSIMNISPTLSSSNWRLSKSFFAANLMTKPKFQLINLSCSPRPQHIQTSTFLVIRCTLCCASICERLMSLNPSRKASTPPIWRHFLARKARKGTKTGQDKSDRCEGKEHCWKGRVGAVKSMKHTSQSHYSQDWDLYQKMKKLLDLTGIVPVRTTPPTATFFSAFFGHL